MRGSIERRGKTSWRLTIDIGRDEETGRRLRRFITVRGTRKDAEAQLTAHLHALATGTFVDPSKETVASYLERWLRDYAKPNVAPRTFERYEQIVRRHLAPALGTMRLTALRPLHIAAAEQRWLAEGNVRRGGGLSARTVLHHHRVLHEALRQAVRWQLLATNPADAVTPPRAQHTEMRALDSEQTTALLAAAHGSEFEVPILVAVYTGLRLGELLGLRWSDVDLDSGLVGIRQTLQRVAGGGFAFRATKTHRSRRSVSIPEAVVEALREHRRTQVEARLRAGDLWHDFGLVFADAVGRPLSDVRLRDGFHSLLAVAGLPRIRLHDLRRTMASLMLAAGEHPKVVSERLGHATIAITIDTYSHVTPGLQAAAAERLAVTLGWVGRQSVAKSGNDGDQRRPNR